MCNWYRGETETSTEIALVKSLKKYYELTAKQEWLDISKLPSNSQIRQVHIYYE